MKKKVLCLFCLVLMSIVVFTGCNPLSKENTETEEDVANSLKWEKQMEEWKALAPNEIDDKVIAIESKMYRIGADVYIPDELESYEVKIIKISRHIFEHPDEVLRDCLAYFEIEAAEQLEVINQELYFENGEAQKYVLDVAEDRSHMACINGSHVLISNPFFQNYSNWDLLEWDSRMHVKKVHSETMMEESEIELLSEEAIADIKQNLEENLGVDFLDSYLLETCTKERLQDMLTYEKNFYESAGLELDPDMRWSATEEDEGTVLWLFQGYEGIPLLYDAPELEVVGGTDTAMSHCIVVSSKEGLEGMEIMTLFDIKEEVETVQILSFGEFIEKHKELRAGIETDVLRVGLYYLPYYAGEGVDFIAKPVWYVQTVSDGELDGMGRQAAIYDAVTGEEISWY